MPLSAFDSVDQENSDNDAVNTVEEIKRLTQSATPDVAKRVSEIYKKSPYIPPSVILAMAKSGTSDSTVDAVSKTAALDYVRKNDPLRDEESWISRNVWGNFKAASRWTFATLSLLPDLAQNASAELFSKNDPNGIEGIIKSTQLGTMLANSDQAGEGFFLGGKAADLQAERARKFRGTINGHAWTVGRAAGQAVFTPGSRPYTILSGFIDAAVQVGTDPSLFVGKPLKAARVAKATLPGLAGEEALEAAARLARGEAGLEAAESIAYTQSKLGQFVLNDPRAVRVVKQFADIGADTGLTQEDKVLRVMEKFKFRISPDEAAKFAEADTIEKVHGVLGLASSKLANSPDDLLLSRDIRDIEGATWLDSKVDRVPLLRLKNTKLFSTLPNERTLVNGSGLDKAKAIQTYSNYLKGVGISVDSADYKNVMRRVVGAYSLAEPGAAKDAVSEAFDEALNVIKNKTGFRVRDDVWKQVVDAKKKALGESRTYSADEVGWPDDGGMFQALRQFVPQEVLDEFPPDTWDRLVNVGPGALNELADQVLVLPDFRSMRKASGMLSRITTSTPVSVSTDVIRSVQNELWKPLALATGGYIMRNMMDAQTRIAVNGLSSAFRHPFDYIMWVFNKKGFEDIKGDQFGDVIRSSVDNWGDEQVEFVQALQENIYRHLERPNDSNINMYRTGSWSKVSLADDVDVHTTGYVDNLAKINTDPINGQIARMNLMFVSEDKQNEMILNWLRRPENKKYMETLKTYAQTGLKIADPETGNPRIVRFSEGQLDDFAVEWVRKQSQSRVATIAGGDKDLNFIAAYNKVPLIVEQDGQRFIAPIRRRVSVDDLDFVENVTPGSTVVFADGKQGVIVNSYSKLEDANVLGGGPRDVLMDIQPVAVTPTNEIVDAIDIPSGRFNPKMLGGSVGSNEVREVLRLKGLRGELKPIITMANRGEPIESSRRFGSISKAMDWMVDRFFVDLYGKATQVLEKSPVFRQYYYREVFDAANELAPTEARKLVDRVKNQSASFNMKPERFVGGKDVWSKLQEVAASTSDATGTVEVLDGYAKAVAVGRTRDLLFNASERSNLEDILSIVVPFGSAWREVLGTYAKAVWQDPTLIRKGQLIFDGVRKAGAGEDGEGFFYKDPTTGEYSFNFPASGWITKHLTGVEAPLQAPVKRLSIGLGLIPSVGPVAQLAASKFLPDTPDLDFIRKLLLPYGEKTSLDITPRIITRLNDALTANTSNLQTIYGNTYIETLRALSTSGEYDLDDPADYEKLLADARGKARIIASLRALGQFIGPTAPSPEFKVETEAGDIYSSQLVKEFQKLQQENYDTAVQRFLEIYGQDAMLYLANKTESVAGGLEATKQFGEWERRNNNLLNRFPDVAGFMAPGGTDFDFEVWSRQVQKGRRRRLTDRELIELAQYRAASAKYRALRDKLPESPSKEQLAWLRKWRVQLNKEYPGFPVVAEFNPGEFPGKIAQLKQMLDDSSLADNDVAQATSLYLRKRDEALAEAAQAGLSSLSGTRAEPLRNWLVGIAKAIRVETPEFSRIYDRLLAQEIEE